MKEVRMPRRILLVLLGLLFTAVPSAQDLFEKSFAGALAEAGKEKK